MTESKTILQVPSAISKFQTMVDGGCKLSVETRELNPEDMATLAKLTNKEGWLIFKENKIAITEIPEEEAPEFEGQKTQGQRERDVAFVWFTHKDNKNGGSADQFNQWWTNYKEKKINYFKNKIDELK